MYFDDEKKAILTLNLTLVSRHASRERRRKTPDREKPVTSTRTMRGDVVFSEDHARMATQHVVAAQRARQTLSATKRSTSPTRTVRQASPSRVPHDSKAVSPQPAIAGTKRLYLEPKSTPAETPRRLGAMRKRCVCAGMRIAGHLLNQWKERQVARLLSLWRFESHLESCLGKKLGRSAIKSRVKLERSPSSTGKNDSSKTDPADATTLTSVFDESSKGLTGERKDLEHVASHDLSVVKSGLNWDHYLIATTHMSMSMLKRSILSKGYPRDLVDACTNTSELRLLLERLGPPSATHTHEEPEALSPHSMKIKREGCLIQSDRRMSIDEATIGSNDSKVDSSSEILTLKVKATHTHSYDENEHQTQISIEPIDNTEPEEPEVHSPPKARSTQPVLLAEGNGEHGEETAFQCAVKLYRAVNGRWEVVCGKAYPALLRMNDNPQTRRSRLIVRSGHKLFLNSLVSKMTHPTLKDGARILLEGSMHGTPGRLEPLLLSLGNVGEAAARRLLTLLEMRISQAPALVLNDGPTAESIRGEAGALPGLLPPEVSEAQYHGGYICAGIDDSMSGYSQILMVGTGHWESYREIHKRDWDFDHLFNTYLPRLTPTGERLHLFAQPEPCYVRGQGSPVLIPVVIVVVSRKALPNVMALTNVPLSSGSLVDMAALGLSWAPWNVDESVSYLASRASWKELDAMTSLERETWGHLIPYIQSEEKTIIEAESIRIEYKHISGLKLHLQYDPDLYDSPWAYAEEVVQEEGLPRQAVWDIRELIASQLDEIAARQTPNLGEECAGREEVRVHKFYPRNRGLDLDKAAFVNRFYGDANEVW